MEITNYNPKTNDTNDSSKKLEVQNTMESDSEVDRDGEEDFLSKQEFNKVQASLLASGFREGAAAGKDASFQSGFDKGYADGFGAAFALGKFNGLIEGIRKNIDVLVIDSKELEGSLFRDTRHGLCQLCKQNPSHSSFSENDQEDITLIVEHQKQVVNQVLSEQGCKFRGVFEKAGVQAPLLEHPSRPPMTN